MRHLLPKSCHMVPFNVSMVDVVDLTTLDNLESQVNTLVKLSRTQLLTHWHWQGYNQDILACVLCIVWSRDVVHNSRLLYPVPLSRMCPTVSLFSSSVRSGYLTPEFPYLCPILPGCSSTMLFWLWLDTWTYQDIVNQGWEKVYLLLILIHAIRCLIKSRTQELQQGVSVTTICGENSAIKPR